MRTGGRLDFVADTNGNRITLAYTNCLLTPLTHSSGQQILIAYNAAGRIASVTDSATHLVTTYEYDTSGEHLIRVYGEGEGAVKAFCSVCGSSLFGGTWPHGLQVSIRMGAFDNDPEIRPQFHTYDDSRAAWDRIDDERDEYPEARVERPEAARGK